VTMIAPQSRAPLAPAQTDLVARALHHRYKSYIVTHDNQTLYQQYRSLIEKKATGASALLLWDNRQNVELFRNSERGHYVFGDFVTFPRNVATGPKSNDNVINSSFGPDGDIDAVRVDDVHQEIEVLPNVMQQLRVALNLKPEQIRLISEADVQPPSLSELYYVPMLDTTIPNGSWLTSIQLTIAGKPVVIGAPEKGEINSPVTTDLIVRIRGDSGTYHYFCIPDVVDQLTQRIVVQVLPAAK